MKQDMAIEKLRDGVNSFEAVCKLKMGVLLEQLVQDAINAESLKGVSSEEVSAVILKALASIASDAQVQVPIYAAAYAELANKYTT